MRGFIFDKSRENPQLQLGDERRFAEGEVYNGQKDGNPRLQSGEDVISRLKVNHVSTPRPSVAVAMSGGVDSSVAAALLKEQGYNVAGVYMHNWTKDPETCQDPDRDRLDALKVATQLGIPFKVWDFEDEYRREVIDYFYREYAAGRTPNPDVMCNRRIKFGKFLERAVSELGVDYIATGHYARIVPSGTDLGSATLTSGSEPDGSRLRPLDLLATNGEYHLLKGVDPNKDQSYFLWTLTQQQLAKTLFPLGEMTKEEVRAKARELQLPVADKPDSTGICFVGEVNLLEFLKKRLPEKEGKIVDVDGKVLGTHRGAHFYTVGQRQGLGIGGGIPHYVVSTNVARNEVVVAPRNHPAHFASVIVVEGVSWVGGVAPSLPLECAVKVRYRQEDIPALVDRFAVYPARRRSSAGTRAYLGSATLTSGSEPDGSRVRPLDLLVLFDEPQRAVTPGQSAVFYRGEELVGGGVIRCAAADVGRRLAAGACRNFGIGEKISHKLNRNCGQFV